MVQMRDAQGNVVLVPATAEETHAIRERSTSPDAAVMSEQNTREPLSGQLLHMLRGSARDIVRLTLSVPRFPPLMNPR